MHNLHSYQGSHWAQILGRSDFSLDTDLGRSEETLGRSGETRTQGFACRALQHTYMCITLLQYTTLVHIIFLLCILIFLADLMKQVIIDTTVNNHNFTSSIFNPF